MEARFEFCMSADYISRENDLSHNRLSSFLQKAVNASPQPTAIPQPLRDLLMVEKPDWLSQSWTHLFNNTLKGGLASSTLITYRSGINRFVSFGAQFGVSNPFPVLQALMCYYVAYLGAVRHRQQRAYPNQKKWHRCLSLGWLKTGYEKPEPLINRLHLAVGDLAVDNPEDPGMLQIDLKQSKTHQFHRGTNVCMGRTRDELCPVAAMMAYLAIRGTSKLGALFQLPKGRPLTREHFISHILQALQVLGLDNNHYSGRIGAATTAAECGIPDSTKH